MKFSIIMPAYNCEEYILDAVDSVMCQGDYDFELIIVDDGSIDHTASICRNIERKYDNVYFVSIPHSGVSAARNYGINMAMGDYVVFIDSDDMLCNGFFKVINQEMNGEDELLVFGMCRDYYSLDGTYEKYDEDYDNIGTTFVYDIGAQLNEMFSRHNMSSPCNKVYRKDILINHNVVFDEGCVYLEDLKFNFDYLSHISCVKIVEENLYRYRIVTGVNQVLKRNFGARFLNADRLYLSAISFLYNHQMTLKDSAIVIGVLYNAYINEFFYHYCNSDKKSRVMIYRELMNNQYYSDVLSAPKGKFMKLIRFLGKSCPQLQILLLKKRYLQWKYI